MGAAAAWSNASSGCGCLDCQEFSSRSNSGACHWTNRCSPHCWGARRQSRPLPEEAGWCLQPAIFPDPLSILGLMAFSNLTGVRHCSAAHSLLLRSPSQMLDAMCFRGETSTDVTAARVIEWQFSSLQRDRHDISPHQSIKCWTISSKDGELSIEPAGRSKSIILVRNRRCSPPTRRDDKQQVSVLSKQPVRETPTKAEDTIQNRANSHTTVS